MDKFFNFSNARIGLVLAFVAGYVFAYSQFNLDGWTRIAVNLVSLSVEVASIQIATRKKPLVAGY